MIFVKRTKEEQKEMFTCNRPRVAHRKLGIGNFFHYVVVVFFFETVIIGLNWTIVSLMRLYATKKYGTHIHIIMFLVFNLLQFIKINSSIIFKVKILKVKKISF